MLLASLCASSLYKVDSSACVPRVRAAGARRALCLGIRVNGIRVPDVWCVCGRQARGVPVHRLVHYEGSFVLTFPNAYHAGFNTGAPALALHAF